VTLCVSSRGRYRIASERIVAVEHTFAFTVAQCRYKVWVTHEKKSWKSDRFNRLIEQNLKNQLTLYAIRGWLVFCSSSSASFLLGQQLADGRFCTRIRIEICKKKLDNNHRRWATWSGVHTLWGRWTRMDGLQHCCPIPIKSNPASVENKNKLNRLAVPKKTSVSYTRSVGCV
jgi:hypothetical protein